MVVGVPKEEAAGERRVALVPAHIGSLTKAGIEVVVQRGAGYESGYTDEAYQEKGATLVEDRESVYQRADVVLRVRAGRADTGGFEEAPLLREGQTVIGTFDPYGAEEAMRGYLEKKVQSFSMELMPRITRAQSMDSLSSQANLAGYYAVILAAQTLPKMFPMMMTAAGTVVPARVFVVGVGVAGLQAIATAKRLGGVVSAYDIRPAVKEQVESLGGKFVEIDLESESTEGSGGYAKAMDEEFYRKQREMMSHVVSESDVVITTAAVPGKKAPILITKEMLSLMRPGSVVVDIAAERGGNCELTKAGETITHKGVTILGPVNIASNLANNASQLYSKNVTTFLLSMVKEGALVPDEEDEIVLATRLTKEGEVASETAREILKG
ncbi:MAG: Re/Si-specific NAD(P)(+) transhydrogenase subunit alpha [Alkalispirochaetaceae bacterium]